jgi:hypothetical protein
VLLAKESVMTKSSGCNKEQQGKKTVVLAKKSPPCSKIAGESCLVVTSYSGGKRQVLTARARKRGPSTPEKRLLVGKALGLDNPALMPKCSIKAEYAQLLKNTKMKKDLEAKKKKLRKHIRDSKKALEKVERNIANYNTVTINEGGDKLTALEKLYQCVVSKTISAYATEGTGGTYAHLRKKSLDMLFVKMKEVAGFDRNAVLLDIGAGLNIPAMHAATSFCAAAVGVEIETQRCLDACHVAIKFLSLPEQRNHRIALLHGNILDMSPVQYASHAIMFDLVFHPQLFLNILDWLSKSKCEYIVSFKVTREPSYMNMFMSALNAKVIGRVTGLDMSGSGASCSAVIFQRKGIPPPFAIHEPADDHKALVQKFVNGEVPETIKMYQALAATLEKKIANRRRSCCGVKKEEACMAECWLPCINKCAACCTKFTVLPKSLLRAATSNIQGKGLFTSVSIPRGAIIIELKDLMEIGPRFIDGAKQGSHQYINHSCTPNARLQQVPRSTSQDRCYLVAETILEPNTEITVHYGKQYLDTFNCGCGSPFCDQKSKVLFLGMVQYDIEKLKKKWPRPDQIHEHTIIDIMQAGNISAQHTRDMVRCRQTEAACDVAVFTADMTNKDEENLDKDRHFVCSFERRRRSLCAMVKQRHSSLQFKQIVMDYFWIPTGWTQEHWKVGFFSTTLPGFARNNVLEMGGTVVLPFEPHTAQMVALHKVQLADYDISVYYQVDLDKITLWKGTRTIAESVMAGVLEKNMAQEERYCRCERQALEPFSEADKLFGSLSNLSQVRFIRLLRIR